MRRTLTIMLIVIFGVLFLAVVYWWRGEEVKAHYEGQINKLLTEMQKERRIDTKTVTIYTEKLRPLTTAESLQIANIVYSPDSLRTHYLTLARGLEDSIRFDDTSQGLRISGTVKMAYVPYNQGVLKPSLAAKVEFDAIHIPGAEIVYIDAGRGSQDRDENRDETKPFWVSVTYYPLSSVQKSLELKVGKDFQILGCYIAPVIMLQRSNRTIVSAGIGAQYRW